jgi:hypothetical protein
VGGENNIREEEMARKMVKKRSHKNVNIEWFKMGKETLTLKS